MKNQSVLKLASLLICTLFFIAACGGDKMSVKTDYKSIAYDKFKTYGWYDKSTPSMTANVSPLAADRIKTNIDKQLQSKGFTKQRAITADFLVNFSITVHQQVDIREYNVYSGVGPSFTWSRDAGMQPTFYTEKQADHIHYREGTLVIDIIDANNDTLLWRGVAKKRATKELNKAQRDQVIDEAVRAVLKNFPPK